MDNNDRRKIMPGCEKLTRPEEISALSDYLKQNIQDLEWGLKEDLLSVFEKSESQTLTTNEDPILKQIDLNSRKLVKVDGSLINVDITTKSDDLSVPERELSLGNYLNQLENTSGEINLEKTVIPLTKESSTQELNKNLQKLKISDNEKIIKQNKTDLNISKTEPDIKSYREPLSALSDDESSLSSFLSHQIKNEKEKSITISDSYNGEFLKEKTQNPEQYSDKLISKKNIDLSDKKIELSSNTKILPNNKKVNLELKNPNPTVNLDLQDLPENNAERSSEIKSIQDLPKDFIVLEDQSGVELSEKRLNILRNDVEINSNPLLELSKKQVSLKKYQDNLILDEKEIKLPQDSLVLLEDNSKVNKIEQEKLLLINDEGINSLSNTITELFVDKDNPELIENSLKLTNDKEIELIKTKVNLLKEEDEINLPSKVSSIFKPEEEELKTNLLEIEENEVFPSKYINKLEYDDSTLVSTEYDKLPSSASKGSSKNLGDNNNIKNISSELKDTYSIPNSDNDDFTKTDSYSRKYITSNENINDESNLISETILEDHSIPNGDNDDFTKTDSYSRKYVTSNENINDESNLTSETILEDHSIPNGDKDTDDYKSWVSTNSEKKGKTSSYKRKWFDLYSILVNEDASTDSIQKITDYDTHSIPKSERVDQFFSIALDDITTWGSNELEKEANSPYNKRRWIGDNRDDRIGGDGGLKPKGFEKSLEIPDDTGDEDISRVSVGTDSSINEEILYTRSYLGDNNDILVSGSSLESYEKFKLKHTISSDISEATSNDLTPWDDSYTRNWFGDNDDIFVPGSSLESYEKFKLKHTVSSNVTDITSKDLTPWDDSYTRNWFGDNYSTEDKKTDKGVEVLTEYINNSKEKLEGEKRIEEINAKSEEARLKTEQILLVLDSIRQSDPGGEDNSNYEDLKNLLYEYGTESISTSGKRPAHRNRYQDGSFLDEFKDSKGSFLGKVKSIMGMQFSLSPLFRNVAETVANVVQHAETKQHLLDITLVALTEIRDWGRKQLDSSPHRLPGPSNNLLGQVGNLIGTNASLGSLAKDAVNQFANSKEKYYNPVNRPQIDKETGITNFSYFGPDNNRFFTEDYLSYSSGEESKDNEGKNNFFSKATDWTKSKLGVASGETKILGSTDQIKASGLKTTFEDLLPHITGVGVSSLEDLKKLLSQSPYVVTSDKIREMKMSLDSNHVWEIRLFPYLGELNGNCSWLPSIYEMNALNFFEHGVKTNWGEWIPANSFELQSKKMSQKTLGLFDGEISYPISMEFTNEVRITFIDDQLKTWKRYFEFCAECSTYLSGMVNEKDHYIKIYDGLSNSGTKSYQELSKDDIILYKDITPVVKGTICPGMYKNLSFRCLIYVMNPQLSTLQKFDLLLVMKDYSIEYSGEADANSPDLTISFSIVGENPDEAILKSNELYFSRKNPDEDTNFWKQVGDTTVDIVNRLGEASVNLLI